MIETFDDTQNAGESRMLFSYPAKDFNPKFQSFLNYTLYHAILFKKKEQTVIY